MLGSIPSFSARATADWVVPSRRASSAWERPAAVRASRRLWPMVTVPESIARSAISAQGLPRRGVQLGDGGFLVGEDADELVVLGQPGEQLDGAALLDGALQRVVDGDQ